MTGISICRFPFFLVFIVFWSCSLQSLIIRCSLFGVLLSSVFWSDLSREEAGKLGYLIIYFHFEVFSPQQPCRVKNLPGARCSRVIEAALSSPEQMLLPSPGTGRISTLIIKWLMLMGHSMARALQVVQAQFSSVMCR